MFAKAREKARQTNCLANTKQLSLAVNMYTSDYDEMLPSEDFDLNGNGDANEVGIDGSWRGVIAPYVKNVQMWICPSHTPAAPVFDGRMNDDGMNASYAINDTHQDAGAPTPPSFQSLAVIEDASSVIFTIESIGNEDDLTEPTNPRGWVPTEVWAKRHNDGANYGFLDGHGKWLKPNMIDSATGDSLVSCEKE